MQILTVDRDRGLERRFGSFFVFLAGVSWLKSPRGPLGPFLFSFGVFIDSGTFKMPFSFSSLSFLSCKYSDFNFL